MIQNLLTLQNLSDLIDVIITAVMIYTALVLLRKTRSIFILRGIGVVLVIYVVSQFFKFKLATLIFKSFLSFFIVIIVILFQKEMRRFFENFSIIDLLNPFSERGLETPIKKSSIDILMGSVAYLAKKKIGALIVLSGRQRLDQHLEGGYEIDGIVSEPLILSLFDPRTPGHDGAIILETNLIKKFGVHLPLADDFKKFGNLGTRHTAGLGLSEVSDALVIIVSEERGTITIARHGNMTIVSLEDLKKNITEFLDELHPEKERNVLHTLFAHNKRDKLTAIVIAVILRLVLIGL